MFLPPDIRKNLGRLNNEWLELPRNLAPSEALEDFDETDQDDRVCPTKYHMGDKVAQRTSQ
jgi:hypothetical protein